MSTPDHGEGLSGVALNTDRELFREDTGEPAGSYYENSLHVTVDGKIGMNVGGEVYVLPIAKWHAAARAADRDAGLRDGTGRLVDRLKGEPVTPVPRTLREDLTALAKECHAEVSRGGESQPCDKPAVAARIDHTEGKAYPVCAYHARADMVPLHDLLAARAAAEPTGQGLETVIAGVLSEHVSRLGWSQGQPNGEWNAECLVDHWSVYGFKGGGVEAHAAFQRHLTDALAAAVRAHLATR